MVSQKRMTSALLLASSIVHVMGFTNNLASSHLFETTSAVGRCSQEATRTITAFPRPSSALSMGAFEDFLEGADNSKRSKENQDYLKKLGQRVDKINSLEPEIEELEDDELEAKTREFQERLANGEDINGPLLEEAFAVVREAAW